MNQELGKILIQETLNWDSTIFVSTCKVTAINNICVWATEYCIPIFFSPLYIINKWSLQLAPSIIKYPTN